MAAPLLLRLLRGLFSASILPVVMRLSKIVWLITLAIFAPQAAHAQSVSKILGYLEIFVGLFLTASIIIFVGAVIVYFTRYGTPRRGDVFPFMEWAIAIVFVLIVLLGLIEFFREHTKTALYVLGVIFFFLFVKILMVAAREKSKAPAAPPAPPPPPPPPGR